MSLAEKQNLEKVASELTDLGARLRTADDPDGVAFPHDPALLGAANLWTLNTRLSDLDLVLSQQATRGYEDLKVDAESGLLAFCCQSQHYAAMATSITIRNVPDEVRDELAARAARSGRSLQEHLRNALIELANRPDMAVLMDRIEERKRAVSGHMDPEKIITLRDSDRR